MTTSKNQPASIQKKLLSGLFWVLLLNLLIKPFWILGIEVGVQNAVGAETYGFYYAIFNLAYILNILLDIGVTNFNTRNIAQHPQLISKHLSNLLSIKLLLLVLYVIVTFTVGLISGYTSRQFYLLAFLCFNQFLNSLILYLRSNYEGLLLFKWDSVISILDRVIMILICGCLLWLPNHPEFKIEYFVYAQTAAYLLTALIAFAVLVHKIGFQKLRWSRPFTIAILKQSAPFALLVLLMASYNRIDPILLEHLSPDGDYQSGIYAYAFRLLDALTMIAYLVSVPLLPIFSKLTQTKKQHKSEFGSELTPTQPGVNPDLNQTNCTFSNPESHQQLASTVKLITSLMLVVSITAAITCSQMSDWLMNLLYDEHTDESSAVFRILIFGFIPISMTYVFGTLLTAAGRLKQLNILACCTLVINIVINLICIPRWGAVGSAWASLTAQSFMAIAQVIIALKIFDLHPTPGYILRLVCFTLFIGSSFLLSFSFWWTQLLDVVITCIFGALIFNLIDIKKLKAILTNKQ